MNSSIAFDAHVDSLQLALDLGCDLGLQSPGQWDLPRAIRGGVGATVLVCWVDPAFLPKGAQKRAWALFEAGEDLARRHPGLIRLVGNGEQLERAQADGCLAGIMGIEGGHAIENDLDCLRAFFGRGLRVMTLVWNNHLPWIRSCQAGAGADIPRGISEFGRAVVVEMNRLGMLVDLSHAGETAFYEVLECSSQPVMASHSGCLALHDHPRNLSDDQLRSLSAANGVVGIVFHPGFLDAEARAADAAIYATSAYRDLQGEGETARMLLQREHLSRHAPALPIERLLDHIAHACDVAGVEHVGIGTDYDGILRAPEGLEDASCYPILRAALAKRGFLDSEVDAILGGNMKRLFAQVTGAGLAAEQAPFEHLKSDLAQRPTDAEFPKNSEGARASTDGDAIGMGTKPVPGAQH